MYVANCSSRQDDYKAERGRLLKIVNPPNLAPVWDSNLSTFKSTLIPGMVKMQPGIPFAYVIDGNSNEMVTVGCVQTLGSLAQFEDSSSILTHAQHLYDLSFGAPTLKQDPIYTLNGLKRNLPFHGQVNPDHPFDGSYSLAGTVEEGHGQGFVVPAMQPSYEAGRKQISDVLQTIHALHRLVTKHCLSKFEMDVIDFHANDNNVFSLGGIDPCGASVQMNVSSTVGSNQLSNAIGSQGAWHVDSGDDPMTPTFLIILVRLPKGSFLQEILEL